MRSFWTSGTEKIRNDWFRTAHPTRRVSEDLYVQSVDFHGNSAEAKRSIKMKNISFGKGLLWSLAGILGLSLMFWLFFVEADFGNQTNVAPPAVEFRDRADTSNSNGNTKQPDTSELLPETKAEAGSPVDKKTIATVLAQGRSFHSKANIKSLDKVLLSEGELEVRVLVLDWMHDIAINVPEMFIVSFKSGKWEAASIRLKDGPKIERRTFDSAPSGWGNWKSLLEEKVNPEILKGMQTEKYREAYTVIFESKAGTNYAKRVVFQNQSSWDGIFIEFLQKFRRDFERF